MESFHCRVARIFGRSLIALGVVAPWSVPHSALGAQASAPASVPKSVQTAAKPGAPATSRATPAEIRSVSGHVFVARGAARRPAPAVWVTLHRIGADTAAPVDSIKTGPQGSYAFRYQPTGDTSAVYIVAGQYAGIAYYSSPLRPGTVNGGDGDLIVYDTASAGVPVRIESHHVIVSAPDAARRRSVIEVFVVSNATAVTRVANPTSPTFSARLPAAAADPQSSEGDIAPDAMTFAGGVVRVTAPIAPGTKRFSYTYSLAAGEPITVSASDTASILEVLVEDPAATVEGTVVREMAPTTVAGRTFKRYSGQNVGTTDGLRIVAPSGTSTTIGPAGVFAIIIAIAMGGMLFVTLRTGRPLSIRPAESAPLAPPGGAA